MTNGPQLTEHTGNRIATALERIADAVERAEKGRPAEWHQAPYPFGDPAPTPPRAEVRAFWAAAEKFRFDQTDKT
jgi:hypothetical protein